MPGTDWAKVKEYSREITVQAAVLADGVAAYAQGVLLGRLPLTAEQKTFVKEECRAAVDVAKSNILSMQAELNKPD